jgi:phage gp45-like
MRGNWLRWSRIRGLVEGVMQRGRVEVFDRQARDDAKRPQDYGFAANVVDGQGLVLEVGGHTVIMRMDRLAERPQLAAYEVCVWHKDGHKVTLKAGGVIQVDCTRYVVNASEAVVFNSPTVSGSGTVQAPTVSATTQLQVAGHDFANHGHDNVQNGSGVAGNVVLR